jgi:hypothetical protein
MTNCAVVTWPNKTKTHYTNVETAGVSQTRGRASVILTAPTGERTVLDAAEVMLVGDDWLARNHSLIAGI